MYKDETTGRNRREFRRVNSSVIKAIPAIRGLDSATKISQLMYGVKTMTQFINRNDYERENLVAFFGADISSMIAWSRTKTAQQGSCYSSIPFKAGPEHRKTYMALVKRFGIECVAQWAAHPSFDDTCRAYDFMQANKMRRKRLDAVIAGWDKWPIATRGVILHDYGMQAMQAHERAATRKPVDPNAPVVITFPQPARLPVSPDAAYNVLVARNETDLQRIGRAQRHCVGTAAMGYADAVHRSGIWIVCIYQKNFGDGICVEINRHATAWGRDQIVLQAQGRHRRPPTASEQKVIDSVIEQLITGVSK
jgi:hypothetical protein